MCSGSEGFLSNILEFNSHDTDRFVNKMERKRFDKCKTSFVLKLIFEQDLHWWGSMMWCQLYLNETTFALSTVTTPRGSKKEPYTSDIWYVTYPHGWLYQLWQHQEDLKKNLNLKIYPHSFFFTNKNHLNFAGSEKKNLNLKMYIYMLIFTTIAGWLFQLWQHEDDLQDVLSSTYAKLHGEHPRLSGMTMKSIHSI